MLAIINVVRVTTEVHNKSYESTKESHLTQFSIVWKPEMTLS